MSASSPAASTSRSTRSIVTLEKARDGASGNAGVRGQLGMGEASSIDLTQDSRGELCLEHCLESHPLSRNRQPTDYEARSGRNSAAPGRANPKENGGTRVSALSPRAAWFGVEW